MAVPTKFGEPSISNLIKWQQQFAANERREQIAAIEKAATSSINCLNHMASTLAAEPDKILARICQLWKARIGKSCRQNMIWFNSSW
jgi:hypothetical protein